MKYNIMFGFFIFFLLFHLAFKPLKWAKDQELSGYFKVPEKVEFNAGNYFSGKYQDTLAKSINFGFGLFPGFTRLHHQLEYSLFNKMNVQDVHIGKKGHLFRYCKGCLSGRDFDHKWLDAYLDRYKILQDTLKARGKTVLWVIAPDKNFLFSEYLPADYKKSDTLYPFYWTLKKELKRKGIDFIDFNEIAYRDRDKYPFEIFNKGGVHWTYAYASVCFDSICSYINKDQRTGIRNEIAFRKTEKPWFRDIDMEEAANLLLPIQQDNFYLAEVQLKSKARDKKIVLIGDSFSYLWTWPKLFDDCFHPESEFWYYNRELKDLKGDYHGLIDHSRAQKKVDDFDVILIEGSAFNAEYLDYGFSVDVNP